MVIDATVFLKKNQAMEATYRLKPAELNDEFIHAVKKLFRNQEIEIVISSSKKNGKAEFLKAVEDVRLRKNIVSFSIDEN